MPRVTLARVALFFVLCWFLLAGLWVALPFPPDSSEADPSQNLWRGKTVTRVYELRDYFPRARYPLSYERSHFALTYDYNSLKNELVVGNDLGGESADNEHAFQFADLLNHANSSKSSDPYPVLTNQFGIGAKAGDVDGINLPWFKTADSVLLFWDIHGDIAKLSLRLHVVNESCVQVWPSDPYSDPSSGEDEPPTAPDSGYLLSIVLTRTPEADPDRKGPSPEGFHADWPHHHGGSSPSSTFAIRRVIGMVLVTTGTIANRFFQYFLVIPLFIIYSVLIWATYILAIYVFLVLLCWAICRCPPFWTWVKTFWLTKHPAAVIGPRLRLFQTDAADSERAGGDKQQTEARTPQPLTSVWAFFTSSSPLDDLFATFEITRAFVQPLALSWRRGRPDDVESRAATSSGADINSEDTKETSRHVQNIGKDTIIGTEAK